MARELRVRAGSEVAGIGAERAGWAMSAASDLGAPANASMRLGPNRPSWSMYDEDEDEEEGDDAFADDDVDEDDEDFLDDDEDFIEDDEEEVEGEEEFDDDDDDEL